MKHYCALTKRPLVRGDSLITYLVEHNPSSFMGSVLTFGVPTVYQKKSISVPRNTFTMHPYKHILNAYGDDFLEKIENSLDDPNFGNYTIIHILRSKHDKLIEHLKYNLFPSKTIFNIVDNNHYPKVIKMSLKGDEIDKFYLSRIIHFSHILFRIWKQIYGMLFRTQMNIFSTQ